MAEGAGEGKGIGDQRKTTETETRSPLATVYACTDRFPPKQERSQMSTNQIVALLARARLQARATSRLVASI